MATTGDKGSLPGFELGDLENTGGGGGGSNDPGGFVPPPGGGGTPTLGDLFGGGTFLAGGGFNPSQGLFNKKRQGMAFFPQRSATQFSQSGNTVGGNVQRSAAPSSGNMFNMVQNRMGMGGGVAGGLAGVVPGGAGPFAATQGAPSGGGPRTGAGGVPNLNPGVPNRTGDPILDNFLQNMTGVNGLELQLLGSLGMAGGLDPYGSQPLINLMRQQGMRDAGAGQRAAQLRAQLSGGGDPALTGYAGLMGELQGQGNLQNILAQAQLQSAMQNQNRLFGLGGGALGTHLDFKAQEALARSQADFAKDLQGGGWQDFAGGILGGAAGGWLSPGGFWGGGKR